MYSFCAGLIRFLTRILRIIQVLGLIYFFVFIVYWVMQVGKFSVTDNLDFLFTPLYPLANNITSNINSSVQADLNLFHINTIVAIVIVFVAFILFNFIFLPLGGVEKFFIEKSFEKGERIFH